MGIKTNKKKQKFKLEEASQSISNLLFFIAIYPAIY